MAQAQDLQGRRTCINFNYKILIKKMTEPLPDLYGKTRKQAERLKKGLIVIDEQVFHETFSVVQQIFELTGLALPNHKIKFLLQSPNIEALKGRVPKLGKRFFNK